MALEIIKNIDVDFYNKEYILVNAKQYDTNSRVISITCYNQGELMRLSDSQHSAYVRYRKADGHPVLNSCRINSRSQVLVELTEQMLAANGICYVDLIIINKGDALVNTSTGEILAIDDSSILSTMAFYVNAYEAVVANSEYESSYEFDGLNDLMQRAEADYTEVMLTSKSWAVGKTGIRDGENTDNSKYYSERSSSSANASNASALSASNSEKNAEEYMSNALEYMNTAKSHMDEAQASEAQARTSEVNALNSEVTTKSYMETTDGYMKSTEEYMNTTDSYMATTQNYMNTTEGYMNTTDGYMDKAEEYMNTADSYMDKTEEFMNTVEGYMGTTKGYMETTDGYMKTSEEYMNNTNNYMGITEGYMNTTNEYMETTKSHMDNAETSMNNAKTSEINAAASEVNALSYKEIVENINDSIVGSINTLASSGTVGSFIFMGTITFEELMLLSDDEKAIGYVYCVTNDFTTDDTFANGNGLPYTAGTNVQYTVDGWNCLGGSSSPTATIDEVKDYLGI